MSVVSKSSKRPPTDLRNALKVNGLCVCKICHRMLDMGKNGRRHFDKTRPIRHYGVVELFQMGEEQLLENIEIKSCKATTVRNVGDAISRGPCQSDLEGEFANLDDEPEDEVAQEVLA